jgi:hypothetical protein
MLAGLPPALASSLAAPPAVTRRARLLALALDAIAILPPVVIALAIAIAWLLARTAWGRDDVSDLDSSVALALLAAGPAAWLAWLGYALATGHATPGQRARGIAVEFTRGGRATPALWLAAHPFGAMGWLLIALMLLLAGAWEGAAVIAVLAALALLGGLVSLAIALARPEARGLHDYIAGTRVVRS